nr:DUF3576 domain-containing protein [Rhodovibrio sodomensis]
MSPRLLKGIATSAILGLSLSACGSTVERPSGPPESGTPDNPANTVGKVGGGNLLQFGTGTDDAPQGGTGIGVNAYLWRASLDTLSFMPVDSADPFGGVILTDWYSPPEAPDERFKVNLYILSRQLRADGLRVSVFRQERGPQGSWRDVEAHGQTATELENAILARAREMRIASTQ